MVPSDRIARSKGPNRLGISLPETESASKTTNEEDCVC
jgi:hypothetical protein